MELAKFYVILNLGVLPLVFGGLYFADKFNLCGI